jgi:hypothetical protein
MITVLYIVIHNIPYMIVGARWVEPIDPLTITRLWQTGIIELMFEAPGIWKIYRRIKDKLQIDRSDVVFDKKSLEEANKIQE